MWVGAFWRGGFVGVDTSFRIDYSKCEFEVLTGGFFGFTFVLLLGFGFFVFGIFVSCCLFWLG